MNSLCNCAAGVHPIYEHLNHYSVTKKHPYASVLSTITTMILELLMKLTAFIGNVFLWLSI